MDSTFVDLGHLFGPFHSFVSRPEGQDPYPSLDTTFAALP